MGCFRSLHHKLCNSSTNVGYDGMGGMYYLRVIILKKLEGMVPVPYPIQNRVNCDNVRVLTNTNNKSS